MLANPIVMPANPTATLPNPIVMLANPIVMLPNPIAMLSNPIVTLANPTATLAYIIQHPFNSTFNIRLYYYSYNVEENARRRSSSPLK